MKGSTLALVAVAAYLLLNKQAATNANVPPIIVDGSGNPVGVNVNGTVIPFSTITAALGNGGGSPTYPVQQY